MYVRKCRHRLQGEMRDYWQLVESYRTERGPRQRVVAYLGVLDEPARAGVADAAAGRPGQTRLFAEEPRWVEVDMRRVRVERPRRFGAPWLALHLWQLLQFPETLAPLLPPGREGVPWAAMVLGRLCDPSSELYLAEHGLPLVRMPHSTPLCSM